VQQPFFPEFDYYVGLEQSIPAAVLAATVLTVVLVAGTVAIAAFVNWLQGSLLVMNGQAVEIMMW